MSPVFLLNDEIAFPPVHMARSDGLLAVGGDLSRKRLLLAYSMGIFPWFSEPEPILWWSPDPRLVLFPRELTTSMRLQRTIRQERFQVTMDQAFESVIRACASVPRKNSPGTWIVDDMIRAYCGLHEAGYAHSVEAWYQGRLAGGAYGIALGRIFFGESMFTRVSNASKVAFVKLVRYLESEGFDMIDCQMTTDHLLSFGAREIPRSVFLKKLEKSVDFPVSPCKWRFAESKHAGRQLR